MQEDLREIWIILRTLEKDLSSKELVKLVKSAHRIQTRSVEKNIKLYQNLIKEYKEKRERAMSRSTSAAMENRMNTEDSGKGTGSSWRTMEKFDARSGKSFRKWAELLEDYFIVDNLVRDEAKRAAMRTRLDEESREFLKSRTPMETGTFECCVETLSKKYNGQKAKEAASMRARAFKLDMREEKFYASILEYADLVTATSILKNEELLKHQINMIHEQLKNQEELWMKLYYQNKYESLIELATDLETSWKLICEKKKRKDHFSRNEKNKGNDKSQGEKKGYSKDAKMKQNIKCFNCSEMGHYKTNCPSLKEDKARVESKRIYVEEEASESMEVMRETNKMLKRMLENKVYNRGVKVKQEKKKVYLNKENKKTENEKIATLRTAVEPYEFYLPVEGKDGILLSGLIDSGATRTIVKKSTAMRYGFKQNRQTMTKIVLADGTMKKAVGDFKTQFKIIPDILVNCSIVVVEDSELSDNKYSLIIGSDLLKATGTILDYGNKTIIMCGREIPHLTVNKEKENDRIIARKATINSERKVEELKKEFKNVISQSKDDIGRCDIEAPKFEITDKQPPKIPRYPVPFSKREVIKEQIQSWLKANVIVEDKFVKWIMNLVITPKSDKTDRVCLDSRPLNSRLIGFDYKTPTLKDKAGILNGAMYYTTLDLVQYFSQISIDEESSKFLGFRAPDNTTYRFVRLPFGVKHATAIAQRIIDVVLQNIEEAFSYVDDICIATKGSLEHHFSKVREVLERLSQHGLKINWKKCQFACEEIQYLGFLFSRQGQEPSPIGTEAIKNFPQPKNLRSLRRFLGKVNFYRAHIENLARIEIPLTNLLKKENSLFEWNEECEKSFSQIKKELMKTCRLIMPDEKKPYVIHCDASGDAHAAALMQETAEGLKPLGFYSKRLQDRKTFVPAVELELRCIASSLSYFRQWVFGKKVLVLTDHRPLKKLIEKNCESHLLKYVRAIKEYDVEVQYIPGERNIVADCLSRAHLRRNKVNDKQSETSEEDEEGKESFNEKILVEEITEEKTKQEYMEAVHTNLGHGCFSKCYPLLVRRVHWTGMEADLKLFIKQCIKCVKRNPVYKSKLPMKAIEASYPLEKITMDIMGPLKKSRNNKTYILGMVDVLSRYVILEPLEDCRAETVMKAIKDGLFYRIAIPKEIKTDNAKYFVAKEMDQLMEEFGVTLEHSTPRHHEGSSIIERTFRSIQNMIAKLIEEDDYLDWDNLLKPVSYFYNQQIHCTTQESPHSIMFGWKGQLPVDLRKSRNLLYLVDYKDDVLERNAAFELTRKIMVEERSLRNQKHNERAKEPARIKELGTGAKVLVKKPVAGKDVIGKFSSEWSEGYKILRREGNSFWLTKGRGRPIKVFMDNVKLDPKPDETQEGEVSEG